jgi:ribosomal protein L32
VWKTEIEDKVKGHTYRSRMAAPTVEGIQVNPNEGAEESLTPFCKACGNYGHQHRNSKKCTQNPSNKHYQGTYVERLRKIVACALSEYSYSASLNVSTHLEHTGIRTMSRRFGSFAFSPLK